MHCTKIILLVFTLENICFLCEAAPKPGKCDFHISSISKEAIHSISINYSFNSYV